MPSTIFNALEESAKLIKDAVGETLKEKSEQAKTPQPNIRVNMGKAQPVEVKALTCPKCGASIHADNGQKASVCPYCESELLVEDGSATIVYKTVDETRLRELELEAERERRLIELEEKRRPGRVKLSLALGIPGVVMLIFGWLFGNMSGDSDSPWYMIAMVGMMCLVVVGYIWLMASVKTQNRERDQRR